MLAAITFGFLAVLAASPPALAHEHVTIGEYEFIVGWTVEPAVAGAQNGLALGIEHHLANGTTVWVTGAEPTLAATLSTGGVSRTYALAPMFGQPGWYTFDVIPTREGTYAVHISGTVETNAIDFTVDLDEVSARSGLEFPVTDPTPAELRDALNSLRAQNTALASQLNTATVVAYAAILIAAAGLVVGALGMRRARHP